MDLSCRCGPANGDSGSWSELGEQTDVHTQWIAREFRNQHDSLGVKVADDIDNPLSPTAFSLAQVE